MNWAKQLPLQALCKSILCVDCVCLASLAALVDLEQAQGKGDQSTLNQGHPGGIAGTNVYTVLRT